LYKKGLLYAVGERDTRTQFTTAYARKAITKPMIAYIIVFFAEVTDALLPAEVV
jgi:hypothetical protein